MDVFVWVVGVIGVICYTVGVACIAYAFGRSSVIGLPGPSDDEHNSRCLTRCLIPSPRWTADSPLTEGHRWIWVPLAVATAVNILASLVIALWIK